MWKPTLSLITRLGLAALWLYTGLTKALDPFQTQVAVRAYKLLPVDLANIVGLILPIVEVSLGVLLLLGMFVRWTSIASTLLLVLFICGIASAWARGMTIDCGCFGGGGVDPNVGPTTYALEILRDAGFMIVSIWLAVFPRTFIALGPRDRWHHLLTQANAPREEGIQETREHANS